MYAPKKIITGLHNNVFLPEINCGHPGQLWNGWLENISSGTGLGASIIFRCQDGMKMEGNGSAICQSDGSWSHPLPQCLGMVLASDK